MAADAKETLDVNPEPFLDVPATATASVEDKTAWDAAAFEGYAAGKV